MTPLTKISVRPKTKWIGPPGRGWRPLWPRTRRAIAKRRRKRGNASPVATPTASRARQRSTVWPIIALVGLAACTSVESSSAQPLPGTGAAKPLDPKELDGYLANQLNSKSFVGISVAVVQNGKITFCKGYGYTSKDTNKLVDSDTRFAVASLTKEFTAACILLLAEDGKLSIHDPVAKYFPDLTSAQDIQVLDLMNMVALQSDFSPPTNSCLQPSPLSASLLTPTTFSRTS